MPIILLTQERGDPVLINSDWIVFGSQSRPAPIPRPGCGPFGKGFQLSWLLFDGPFLKPPRCGTCAARSKLARYSYQ
jgi:hypothetical protein